MTTRTTLIVAGLLILAGAILSLSVYSRLPAQMASHWNLNDEVDGTIPRAWGAFLMPLLAAFVTGLLLARTRRNFFIGIRTPWTLSSDTVWDRTHRLGSKVFVAMGLLVMLIGLLGPRGLVLIPAVIVTAALVPVVYSYVLYRRERQGRTRGSAPTAMFHMKQLQRGKNVRRTATMGIPGRHDRRDLQHGRRADPGQAERMGPGGLGSRDDVHAVWQRKGHAARQARLERRDPQAALPG